MATTRKSQYPVQDTRESGEQVIPIVRIQTVGGIILSKHGTVSPLQEAFNQMGAYLADHDDRDGVQLEITLFDRTYRASIDAVPQDEIDPRNTELTY